MSSAQQIVEEAIENNKVIVFGKSYCPYCKKAKALLSSLDIEFAVIELDLHSQGEAIQAYLLEKTGQRTVPNIFVNKVHVGGSDDLAKAERDGTLQKLLAQ
ncbi:glutaredoxin 3 [Mucor circinelloides 1006PhL]|uniref:Glutaredoxin 3 n=1 Tax=Mucor circinelloides f. circinelloides (strain 1006PhL) TaxID=1220926 RepID=S2J3E8_MUCC1|nr:glutaredoxin 3 [Mucor circinelloides 1006PhL]